MLAIFIQLRLHPAKHIEIGKKGEKTYVLPLTINQISENC